VVCRQPDPVEGARETKRGAEGVVMWARNTVVAAFRRGSASVTTATGTRVLNSNGKHAACGMSCDDMQKARMRFAEMVRLDYQRLACAIGVCLGMGTLPGATGFSGVWPP
jgi:hypothetical protein